MLIWMAHAIIVIIGHIAYWNMDSMHGEYICIFFNYLVELLEQSIGLHNYKL